MTKAKYTLKHGQVLKDGHTMFPLDVVKDLNRKSYLEKIYDVAIGIVHSNHLVKQKTKDLQRMAILAGEGKKDSPEFKELEFKDKQPTVVDFGNDIDKLTKLMPHIN